MKGRIKKFLAMLLAMTMVFTAVQISTVKAVEDVGYTLENGILTVNTDAAMEAKAWESEKGNITSVVIAEGVTYISDAAFSWSNAGEVTIPSTVVTIGTEAFKGCAELTDITIPEGVENINGYAFMQTGLTSIELPKTVRYIGDYAVGYTYADANIVIEGFTIKGYADSAVQEYAETNEILFESVGVMGYTLVNGTLTVKNDEAMGAKEWDKFKGDIKDISINYGVTYISDGAFEWTNTEKVTIPETVKSIGVDAFKGCRYLENITIPEGVEKINKYAFMQTGLKEITIPSTVDFVDDYAVGYDYDGDLGQNVVTEGFVIKSTSGEAGRYANRNGIKFIPTDVEGYVLEDGILTVPNDAAMEAKGWTKYKDAIKEIVISEGVTFISNAAFEWSATTKVTISKTVITIGDDAFKGCYNLESITIPEGVENINGYAFMQTGLKEIEIPSTIKYMGNRAVGYDYADADVLVEDFVIKGYTNSVAEDYAKANDITFSEIGKVIKNLAEGKILSIEKQKYTGKAITPKPIVMDATGKVLTEGIDYTLTFTNNVNVGTATVTVTGIGNCEGTLIKTFVIEKNDSENTTTKEPEKEVKVAKVKFQKVKNLKGKKISLKWKRNKDATGYEIQYSLKKTFKGAKKVVIKKTVIVSKTIKKLKKKKTYYVRIRCYKKVSGKTYYSDWTKKSVKVRK